jgi:hypothetical protein
LNSVNRESKIAVVLTILLTSLSHYFSGANDGSFRASGNQLIPVFETEIAVKKEILTLKKVRDQFIEVTVYYEFYNPKEEKEITVGFEALSPSGDVDGTPVNGLHPYMSDFTVQLNGRMLTYNVAYVSDSMYAKNGIIKSKKLPDVLKNISDENNVDFFYVYYFKARFKKGLNIIKHTYNYELSGSVAHYYNFQYVLTAANRWGNKQIDDFTLILDMGEFESFDISKDFFKNANDWLINGIGKCKDKKDVSNSYEAKDVARFHIQRGNLIFQQKNFHPKGELFVYAPMYYMSEENNEQIPFSYYQQNKISEPKTDLEKRILKNLPFARRGYVFQNPEIKGFYEKQEWYIPNPNYEANVELLTEVERLWIDKWK